MELDEKDFFPFSGSSEHIPEFKTKYCDFCGSTISLLLCVGNEVVDLVKGKKVLISKDKKRHFCSKKCLDEYNELYN